MAPRRSPNANQKPGKTGPNDGGGAGGNSLPTDGKKPQNTTKDSEPPKTPVTAGPHPPSPPASPKQEKRPLSTSARVGTQGLYAGGSSNAATGAPTSSTAGPSIRDPTAVAVSDLLGTMQSTLKALGNTFDVLGEQTIRVASLGPAVDALSQIEGVQRELNEKTILQDEQMQRVKEKSLETVKDHVRQALRPRVNGIVAECVKREIESRVHHELTAQIPEALRDELLQYRLRIMEARRALHNSEARRHNALVRSSGLDEPLKPLLRPLQPSAGQDANLDPDGTPTPDASGGNDKDKQDKKEPKDKDKDKGKDKGKETARDKRNPKDDGTGIPTPPSTAASVSVTSGTTSRTVRPGPGPSTNRLSLNTALSAATSTAVTAFEGSPGSALSAGAGVELADGRWDVVPPSPSVHFPRTIAALVSLTAGQARALVREYGLPVHEDGEDEDEDEEDAGNAARGAGTPARGGTRGGRARGARGGARGGTGRTERPASVATACSSDAASWVNAGLAGTREDDLNRFMRYIGVGFQVLPSSPIQIGGGAGGGAKFSSPVVERRDCAFNR